MCVHPHLGYSLFHSIVVWMAVPYWRTIWKRCSLTCQAALIASDWSSLALPRLLLAYLASRSVVLQIYKIFWNYHLLISKIYNLFAI